MFENEEFYSFRKKQFQTRKQELRRSNVKRISYVYCAKVNVETKIYIHKDCQ